MFPAVLCPPARVWPDSARGICHRSVGGLATSTHADRRSGVHAVCAAVAGLDIPHRQDWTGVRAQTSSCRSCRRNCMRKNLGCCDADTAVAATMAQCPRPSSAA